MNRKHIITIAVLLLVFSLSACTSRHPYGVFLSVDSPLDEFASYDTIVIDAQYYEKADIASFKSEGHKVLSYINVGSVEDFRPYYADYSNLTLGPYEHWEEEVWVDVSSSGWQDFVLNDLAASIVDKGVDGFFVDNCDVYYNYPSPNILEGLSVIMRGLVDTGLEVVINGGDCFLDAYCETIGDWSDVITGINQETVFSSIDWENESFGASDPDDREYFCDYIERYGMQGADIYLLEYTTEPSLIREIDSYCGEKGFVYYVSDSLELD